MDKKQFLLNITIQIDAYDETEALEILSREETLKSIAKAIAANKENLHEISLEQKPDLVN